jgi:transposase
MKLAQAQRTFVLEPVFVLDVKMARNGPEWRAIVKEDGCWSEDGGWSIACSASALKGRRSVWDREQTWRKPL